MKIELTHDVRQELCHIAAQCSMLRLSIEASVKDSNTELVDIDDVIKHLQEALNRATAIRRA